MLKYGVTMSKLHLTHLTESGQAHMVDVGSKEVTLRQAHARACVRMNQTAFAKLSSGDTPKGDVLAAARIAGILAAKRTSDLLPLCHTIKLTRVEVTIDLHEASAIIHAMAEARDRTGVEMEALTAASIAALTLYDMLKAVDRAMTFDVCLVEKSGGQSGAFARDEAMEKKREMSP